MGLVHCVDAESAMSIAPIKLSRHLGYISGNSIHWPVKHRKAVLVIAKHRESNHVLVLSYECQESVGPLPIAVDISR